MKKLISVPTSYDSARGARFFEWDVRAGKLIRIKERANLEMFFQAFDLTNHANFGSSYNSNVRASTFGTPLGFITPGAPPCRARSRASSARSSGSNMERKSR